MFIFKLISKHKKVVFVYFKQSLDVLIIQQVEVLAKNVFLSKSCIIPVLPPWMDEVRGRHLLSKEFLFLLDVLEVQDVVVGEGADSTV